MNVISMKRKPTHPGEILKNLYMEPLSLSLNELASKLDIPTNLLSAFINSETPLTVDLAMRLSKAFSTSPESWLNAQMNLDIWLASQGEQSWQKIEPLIYNEIQE